jgi:hypothetical protein
MKPKKGLGFKVYLLRDFNRENHSSYGPPNFVAITWKIRGIPHEHVVYPIMFKNHHLNREYKGVDVKVSSIGKMHLV